MGALDKRFFSGVAILSALLFVVSAVLLLTNGGDVSSDSNDTALYIATAAGVLAVIYSVCLFMDRSSFVRTVSGVLTAVAGIAFLAAAFAGGSAGTVLAIGSIIAAAAIIADMLALWVSRVYGAMYVTAVLAALVLAMGILHFINDAKTGYHVVTFVVFAVWLALSAYITGYVKVENAVRTREIKEDSVSKKKADKPMAKNTKATKKAKRPEPKKAEPVAEKKKPVEPKKEEKKPEAKPVKAKPVVLPVKESKPVEEKKPEPKVEAKPEPKKPEAPVEEKKPEPKVEAKKESKPVGDFMSRLKSSKDANSDAKAHEPKAEPAAEPVAEEKKPEPKVEAIIEEAPVVAAAVAASAAEPVAEEAPVIEEAPAEPAPAVEEAPVAEEAPAVEEPVAEAEPAVEAPVEPVVEEAPATEAVPEGPVAEPVIEEAPAVEAPVEPVAEEAPVIEAVPEGPVAGPVVEEPAAGPEPIVEEAPAEEPAFTEPDWSAVSHDASQAVPEEPVAAEPEEEPGEDIYTDNSPEALVRRAAHNKGLRCRRGYGPHEIPVAFVNGKVAVYVTETGEKGPVDDELVADGWTVLRYSFAQVTDGKAQGEEISSAVKSGIRAAKAGSKKAKKPKK